MIKNQPKAVVLAAAVALVAVAGCAGGKDITDGRYQGMVEHEQVDLGFEGSGRVAEILVKPGQEITTGTVIARMDDTLDRQTREIRARELTVARADLALIAAGARAEDVRAARAHLAAARATEATLRKQLERERALVASGVVAGAVVDDMAAQLARATGDRQSLDERVRLLASGATTEELDRARARVASAEQALSLEDARLDKRILRASIAGTVLDTYIEPGEVVATGAVVATVIDRERPYADVFVPVDRAATLAVGAPASLRVEGAPGETAGEIERVFPHAEFTPRFIYSPRERPNLMMRVRVRLRDPDKKLFAGLPAYAQLGAAKP
ncbi:MAG TPA: HlyD family efflux transporter periplasmic adaptor subunit [Kofleriaceae bacterium]|nr:HlyD family efflux transporter periplasmic adaptor subunit [Kofleriaceae bacterium]